MFEMARSHKNGAPERIALKFMTTQLSQPLRHPHQALTLLPSLQALEQHELALPCLLFVASHRPCAFVVSQLLYVLAPMAAILGVRAWQAWAALLSEPGGVAWLEQRLADTALAANDADA